MDLGVQNQVAAVLAHLDGVGFGHLGEVYDARVGRPYRLDPGDVRLVLPEFLRADEFEALRAVGAPAPVEFLESGDLGLVDGDDNLAAHFVFDAMLVAEFPQKPAPVEQKLAF